MQQLDEYLAEWNCLMYQLFCSNELHLSLSTPWRHVGGIEVQLHSFLISALRGDEWLSSHPGHFTPGKEPRFCSYQKRYIDQALSLIRIIVFREARHLVG